MNTLALCLFAATYVGVALGGIPGLTLDRTGIALLGAIAMMASGALSPEQCVAAMDAPTLLLLYALMILSAQYRLGGFYTFIGSKIAGLRHRPRRLLAALIATSALLSALLTNDIVCLAFTPVLCGALPGAGINPLPFLLALACSSNIGSAATIIGNPQNMLIGQVGHLDFGQFLIFCAPPALLGLLALYGLLLVLYRGRFHVPVHAAVSEHALPAPQLDRWQSGKAIALTILLLGLFFTRLPRDVSALAIAAVLLCSRKLGTREVLGLVDWHLLTLFMGLFVVVRALENTGAPALLVERLAQAGLPIAAPAVLIPFSALLSNIVSNVPADLLLIGHLPAQNPIPWYALALASTFAGNLILLGSIANLIVAEQAKAYGVELSFREHARTGLPITLLTLALTAAWLSCFG